MAAALAGAGQGYALGQNHDLNVTPFVDVMLVLLIVFMVAAPLATTAIQLDLPPDTPTAAPRPPTWLSIADNGALTITGPAAGGLVASRPATLESLPDVVWQSTGGEAPGTARVFVRADAHVRYGRFVAVLDRLRTGGYDHLGLISEQLPN